MNFLFGCDPEMFLLDKPGSPVSAWGKFPGTKDNPHRLSKGAVQVDGNALEFNIDPASSASEFVDNILSVQEELYEMVAAKGLVMDYVPIIKFPDDVWSELPPEAKVLGCSPDYNSSGERNCAPEIPEGYRTAAGHIHLGWGEYLDPDSENHIQFCARLSKFVEERWYEAFPLDANDAHRLEYYGADAAFRPKMYGIEFRFPTNRWLNSLELMYIAYWTVEAAAKEFFENEM